MLRAKRRWWWSVDKMQPGYELESTMRDTSRAPQRLRCGHVHFRAGLCASPSIKEYWSSSSRPSPCFATIHHFAGPQLCYFFVLLVLLKISVYSTRSSLETRRPMPSSPLLAMWKKYELGPRLPVLIFRGPTSTKSKLTFLYLLAKLLVEGSRSTLLFFNVHGLALNLIRYSMV